MDFRSVTQFQLRLNCITLTCSLALQGLNLQRINFCYTNIYTSRPLYLVLNPLTAKLFNLNFHPLEIVSR